MHTNNDPRMQDMQTSSQQPSYARPSHGYASRTQKKPAAVCGVVGVVFAGLALITCWIPIVNNVSIVLGLVGLILCVVGIVGARPSGHKGGLPVAVTGAVLALVAVIAGLALQASWGAALDKAAESFASSAGTAGSPSAAQISDESSSGQAAGTPSDNAAGAGDATVGTAGDATQAQQGADPSAGQSEYAVTIDGFTLAQDYQGASAIVVDFTFTNNSAEPAMFLTAVSAKAFQNGVELESAIVTGLGTASMSEVKPGATTTVQKAYLLADQTDVTVEVGELFSLDGSLIAQETFAIA